MIPNSCRVYSAIHNGLKEAWQFDPGKKPTQGRCWLTSEAKMEEWITEGRVFWVKAAFREKQFISLVWGVKGGIKTRSHVSSL